MVARPDEVVRRKDVIGGVGNDAVPRVTTSPLFEDAHETSLQSPTKMPFHDSHPTKIPAFP